MNNKSHIRYLFDDNKFIGKRGLVHWEATPFVKSWLNCNDTLARDIVW